KYSAELTDDGKGRAASFGQLTYALQLAQTLTPLQGRDFALTPVEAAQIDGRPAIGIRARHQGRPDVTLYFDKQSKLPVKCAMRIKGYVGMLDSYKEGSYELFLIGFKETGGIKHFTKVIIKADGTPVVELEITEVAPQAKLDATLFARP